MRYKAGLIGCPVRHSLSAYIHEAGFKSLGVEGSYERLETAPEDLIERIKFLKIHPWRNRGGVVHCSAFNLVCGSR